MTQTKVRVFLDGKEDDELKLDELPKEATVRELKKAIQEQCAKMNGSRKKGESHEVMIKSDLKGGELPDPMVVSDFFRPNQTVFAVCQQRSQAPEISESIKYETITKYTYYEVNNNWIKVILDLKGVEKVPKDKILTRFFERSFEVCIHDLEGKNYKFAVVRTHAKLIPEKSHAVAKPDKLHININKPKDAQWVSLHRTKMIGEDFDA